MLLQLLVIAASCCSGGGLSEFNNAKIISIAFVEFDITLEHNSTRYHFRVEQGKPLKGFELFTLTAGDRKVVLQSNRPMLLAKGLKKKPVYWKVVEGEVRDQKALDKVIQAIDKHLKEQAQQVRPEQAVKKERWEPPTFAKGRKQQAKTAPKVSLGERVNRN